MTGLVCVGVTEPLGEAMRLELGQQLFGRLVAIGGPLLETFHDHGGEGGRHGRSTEGHRLRRAGHVGSKDLLTAPPAEWGVAGEQLVGQRAHRVNVHSMVEVRVGGGLLGRHVRRGAQGHARAGELVPAGRLAHRLRHAEIHDHGVAAGEHHVVGLDVAVHDTRRVRRGEGVDHLQQDPDRLIDRQLTGARQSLAQRLSRDIRHDVEVEAPGLTRVEQRQDVRVLQPRRNVDLAEEAVAAEGSSQLGPKHLDRNPAMVPNVFGQVDRGHSAAAQLALEHVPIPQTIG